jgi:AcrR family transcriptional regulator
MRVKTQARRQAIINTAAEVFCQAGFEAATMSEIAARVGGSKATLYNYFSSKEELFFAVAIFSAEKQGGGRFYDVLQTQGSTTTILQILGENFLKVISLPNIVAMLRTVIAESGRSDLGRFFYERGTKEAWAQVTEFLQAAIRRGELRDADPQLMTMHLKGLYEAEISDQLLLGVISGISSGKRSRMVAAAVDVFMRAYGSHTD